MSLTEQEGRDLSDRWERVSGLNRLDLVQPIRTQETSPSAQPAPASPSPIPVTLQGPVNPTPATVRAPGVNPPSPVPVPGTSLNLPVPVSHPPFTGTVPEPVPISTHQGGSPVPVPLPLSARVNPPAPINLAPNPLPSSGVALPVAGVQTTSPSPFQSAPPGVHPVEPAPLPLLGTGTPPQPLPNRSGITPERQVPLNPPDGLGPPAPQAIRQGTSTVHPLSEVAPLRAGVSGISPSYPLTRPVAGEESETGQDQNEVIRLLGEIANRIDRPTTKVSEPLRIAWTTDR